VHPKQQIKFVQARKTACYSLSRLIVHAVKNKWKMYFPCTRNQTSPKVYKRKNECSVVGKKFVRVKVKCVEVLVHESSWLFSYSVVHKSKFMRWVFAWWHSLHRLTLSKSVFFLFMLWWINKTREKQKTKINAAFLFFRLFICSCIQVFFTSCVVCERV